MNDMQDNQTTKTRQHDIKAGIILVLIGLGLLITYTLKVAWVPVWVAGLGILGWGAATHGVRRIIAGSLITGTGLAIVVQTGPWSSGLTDQVRVVIFLFCLALGWFLIPLLTGLATSKTLWWPLIPGLVLAITAGAFWVSADWVKALSTIAWPLMLVVIGVFLIIRWNRAK